ncbi:hypothetical protein [Parasitella parasitica]|uniref:Septin-type G domain-containing protein n=1 Tax=Parasitella parasitica TaxID=35722 RepID=A0A0B7N228_9FUNG|nr:hypothetical protein [Parasitella parasitica]
MPRFVPLLTGLAVAAAITYKFKNDLLQDQNDIKTRLEDAKSTLEKAVIDPTFGSSRSYLSNSQKYVSNRLVPSVKDSWNAQIMSAAQSLVKVDIGSKVAGLWNKHVYNCIRSTIFMSISSVDHQSKEHNFGIISISDSTEPKKFQRQQRQLSQLQKQNDAQRQHDSKSMNLWVTPKVKSLDQAHHQFRMIVCGDSGIGKTSLVHALTSTTPIPEENHPGSPVLKPTEVLSANSDLCVIDTCGYGALLRAEIVFSHVRSFLEAQFEKTTHLFNSSIQDELLSFMVNQSSDVLCHVDVCLYLILGRLKPVDIEYMRSIHDLVNIIPVIIQPDLSLKPEVMIEQRTAILNTMQKNSIRFNYLGYDTFEDLLAACKQPVSHPYCPPFVLDWSANKKSTFHGLVFLKKALIQSKLLKTDTTQKFMAWKQQLYASFSTNSSSTATTSSSSSLQEQQEQQKHNIRISQYVSKRRRSMEKEMLLQEQKLKQEFQTLSKERRSELILKEISSLVQQGSNNKLLIRYQQLQRSSPSSSPAEIQQYIPAEMHPMTQYPFWIALSIFLSLFICYQNRNWWTYY